MIDHRCSACVERRAQAGGQQSKRYGSPERLDDTILSPCLLVVTVNCWGGSPLLSFCLRFR